MKKKEMTRLINMVMLAEKTDPRITADKVTISIAHYLCLSHTSYINTLTHTLPLSLSHTYSLSLSHNRSVRDRPRMLRRMLRRQTRRTE